MAYYVDLKDALEEIREMGEGALYGLAVDIWDKGESLENLSDRTLYELCYCTNKSDAMRTMASFDNERGIAKLFELPNAEGDSLEVGEVCRIYCEVSNTVTSEDYGFGTDDFNPLADDNYEYYSESFYVKKDDGTFEQTSRSSA